MNEEYTEKRRGKEQIKNEIGELEKEKTREEKRGCESEREGRSE